MFNEFIMFNLNNFFDLYNSSDKNNYKNQIKLNKMLTFNDSIVRKYINDIDLIRDEFLKLSSSLSQDFIVKNNVIYTDSYFAINKFYNYINRRKFYNKEELEYLYDNIFKTMNKLKSICNENNSKDIKEYKDNNNNSIKNIIDNDIDLNSDEDLDFEINNNTNQSTSNNNEWVVKSTSNYSIGNKIGQIVILSNIENTLYKFTYDFNYNNAFKKYITKDYNLINQYFEKHNFNQIWNINELSYVQKIDDEYKQFNLAFNYLIFMMTNEEDFKKFINQRPDKIKEGIIQVQKFINTIIDSFNDNHDFKEVFKHVFINYLNHEFVEKNSMDKILIYYPLDKLKEIYNEPEIWKIENYEFN